MWISHNHISSQRQYNLFHWRNSAWDICQSHGNLDILYSFHLKKPYWTFEYTRVSIGLSNEFQISIISHKHFILFKFKDTYTHNFGHLNSSFRTTTKLLTALTLCVLISYMIRGDSYVDFEWQIFEKLFHSNFNYWAKIC